MARAKSDAPGSDGEPRDFESSMERLEAIVNELEGGQLSLEDSIARYEEGMNLSKRLTKVLEESEKRIERLVEKEGSPTTEPMELSGRESKGSQGSDEGELPF